MSADKGKRKCMGLNSGGAWRKVRRAKKSRLLISKLELELELKKARNKAGALVMERY